MLRNGPAIGVVIWSLAAISPLPRDDGAPGSRSRASCLGLGEATNFPACVKGRGRVVSEEPRAFATGIFNCTGTNFGAMPCRRRDGDGRAGRLRQTAFVAVGLVGFRVAPPCGCAPTALRKSTRASSSEELAMIRSDQEPPAAAVKIPWQRRSAHVTRRRGRSAREDADRPGLVVLPDLAPSYLQRERGVSLASAAGALAAYLPAADLGSVFGGWLPGLLHSTGLEQEQGALADDGALRAQSVDLGLRRDVWGSLHGCRAHQRGDRPPSGVVGKPVHGGVRRVSRKRAVASVVGFGGMCGAIGGSSS